MFYANLISLVNQEHREHGNDQWQQQQRQKSVYIICIQYAVIYKQFEIKCIPLPSMIFQLDWYL